MVESARMSKQRGKQRVITRKLTLNAVEVVAQAGVVQRRWIRRNRAAAPARARGRLRWLESKSRFRLLREEEVDDGGGDGHLGWTPGRRWPRVLATVNG